MAPMCAEPPAEVTTKSDAHRSAHIRPMKIAGYLNLRPEDIEYDADTCTVRLADSARRWGHTVYPIHADAAAGQGSGTETYEVQALVPDGILFEVSADTDQTEGRGGAWSTWISRRFCWKRPPNHGASSGSRVGIMSG